MTFARLIMADWVVFIAGWQVDETIDRVILICLLVTSALGVLAFASATSRREAVRAEPEPAPAG